MRLVEYIGETFWLKKTTTPFKRLIFHAFLMSMNKHIWKANPSKSKLVSHFFQLLKQIVRQRRLMEKDVKFTT